MTSRPSFRGENRAKGDILVFNKPECHLLLTFINAHRSRARNELHGWINGRRHCGRVRDLSYDISHPELSWSYFGNLLIDGIAVFPVLGVAKYADETLEFARSALKKTDTGLMHGARSANPSAVGAGVRKVSAPQTPGSAFGRNPFAGKSAAEVDELLRARGFRAVGPDPAAGRGSYFHPETGRKYYLDPGGKYRTGTELPHVDVHRMQDGLNLEGAKKKLPLGESLYE